MILHVYVDGVPRPQPRPRFVGGRVVSTAGKNAQVWKNRIIGALVAARKGAARIERPVAMVARAMFSTTDKRLWGKPHTNRPDKDNLEKLVLDAMVKAGTLKDDSLVYDGGTSKWWAERDGMSIMLLESGEAPPADDGDDLGALVIDT
jgi:Holliday junction resolvase RusA-like endonuclease